MTVFNPEVPSGDINWFARIDFLRGLSALAVLMYHARAEFLEGASACLQREGWFYDPISILNVALLPFSLGFLGVDIFFVLSGFCIHYRRAKKSLPGEPFRVLDFYKRRFFRIYPTYAAALILSILISQWVAYQSPNLVRGSKTDLLTFIGNLLTFQGFFVDSVALNGVLWTLALEIHLYLFYPLLLLVIDRIGMTNTLYVAAAVSFITIFLSIVFSLEQQMPYWKGRGPFFTQYLFTWTMGAWVATRLTQTCRPSTRFEMLYAIIAAIIAAGLYVLGDRYWLIPFIGYSSGILVLSAICIPTTNVGVSVFRIVSVAGLVSFSMYIIHIPAFMLTKSFVDPASSHRNTIFPLLTGIFVACLMTSILFLGVERWSLRRKP